MYDLPRTFWLGVSRFVPYTHLDTVIRIGELLDAPVVIAGYGPLEDELRARGGESSVPVELLLTPSDAMVRALMDRALLFAFPPIEDFGIVAVEAMAAGTPVMANRVGGAGESVREGVSGSLFDPRSADEIRTAASMCASLRRDAIAEHARQFDNSVFDRSLLDWLSPHVSFAPAR